MCAHLKTNDSWQKLSRFVHLNNLLVILYHTQQQKTITVHFIHTYMYQIEYVHQFTYACMHATYQKYKISDCFGL